MITVYISPRKPNTHRVETLVSQILDWSIYHAPGIPGMCKVQPVSSGLRPKHKHTQTRTHDTGNLQKTNIL